MISAVLYQPFPPTCRQRVLAVVDELTARALALTFRGSDLTIAHTCGDALVHIARGHRYDLVLCFVPIPAALALHAAIARRDPASAGRMAVLVPR